MKNLKYFLIGVVIAVVLMSPAFAQTRTLASVLENSVPVEKGTCVVSTARFEKMILECVRGKRPDGTNLYAIRVDGQIISVFEEQKDKTLKMVWSVDWVEV